MNEFGIFIEDGCVERDFDSHEAAEAAIKASAEYIEARCHVEQICSAHECGGCSCSLCRDDADDADDE